MNFSNNNQFLAVTCSNGTIHIFKLNLNTNNNNNNNPTVNEEEVTGMNTYTSFRNIGPHVDEGRNTVSRIIRNSSQQLSRKAMQAIGQMLPSSVTSAWDPMRHFASCKLPQSQTAYETSAVFIDSYKEIDIQSYRDLFGNGLEDIPLPSASEVTKVHIVPVRVGDPNGFLHEYILDPERGGDCPLLSSYPL